jgi:hypothetical protein
LTSGSSSTFNFALMCGMPFRQASQIGTDEFWVDEHKQNCSSQTAESMTIFFSTKKSKMICFQIATHN